MHIDKFYDLAIIRKKRVLKSLHFKEIYYQETNKHLWIINELASSFTLFLNNN